jgi:hypothetical protein
MICAAPCLFAGDVVEEAAIDGKVEDSLRVTSATYEPVSGKVEIRFQNEAPQAITAWKFKIVLRFDDGLEDVSWGGQEFAGTLGQGPWDLGPDGTHQSGPFYPGQTSVYGVGIRVPGHTSMAVPGIEVIPTTVVFMDRTFIGDLAEARRIFLERAAGALGLRELAASLRKARDEIGQGEPVEKVVEAALRSEPAISKVDDPQLAQAGRSYRSNHISNIENALAIDWAPRDQAKAWSQHVIDVLETNLARIEGQARVLEGTTFGELLAALEQAEVDR